ncbi:hypothetical protein ACU4GD_07400 [Cupriavidus basilensis]
MAGPRRLATGTRAACIVDVLAVPPPGREPRTWPLAQGLPADRRRCEAALLEELTGCAAGD